MPRMGIEEGQGRANVTWSGAEARKPHTARVPDAVELLVGP